MTTKAPASVAEASADSLEKKAYSSVSSIPTVEPNDRNRLGYHVWRFLGQRQGTLEQAVAESGARLLVSRDEAATTIREALRAAGITV